MHFKRWLIASVMGLMALPAQADITAFACEPEWAYLLGVLAPNANITTATTALQDPHYIEARPSLIAAVRRSDIVACTGASLEAGWLPALIRNAGNPGVQPGEPGFFLAAEQVTLHQPHEHVDRSLGDVHPEGNPHVHLDPDKLPQIMDALVSRLRVLFPERSAEFQRNGIRWKVNWHISKSNWRKAAEGLNGINIVVQHGTFGYLLRWSQIEPVADLEPKPGLPPSASHLASLLSDKRVLHTDVILIASYQDPKPANWLAEKTGARVVILPSTVSMESGERTLSTLIDHIFAALVLKDG